MSMMSHRVRLMPYSSKFFLLFIAPLLSGGCHPTHPLSYIVEPMWQRRSDLHLAGERCAVLWCSL
jgi:hypothetical protein